MEIPSIASFPVEPVRRFRGRLWKVLLAGLFALPAMAQQGDDIYGPQPTGATAAQAQYEANLKVHANDPERLVLPGLVADRTARRVELQAESTGLAERETIEFLLVDQGSSHGYEAMLWSMARPSHVEKALEFIGMRRGPPVNPAVPRLWSDADRIDLSVVQADGTQFPIEQLILDLDTGTTLPEDGFVFTGSVLARSPDGTQPAIYAADAYDPRSVASIYNERASVLDVPRKANKSEIYGRQVVNPARVIKRGTLITVVLTPSPASENSSMRTFRLQLEPGPAPSELHCRLTGQDESLVAEAPDLFATLEKVLPRVPDLEPPYLDVTLRADLLIPQAIRAVGVLAGLESLGAVRVRPPARDQLYHRAFAPKPEWREPAARPSQPWELHLKRSKTAVSASLIRHEAQYKKESTRPTFSRHAQPLSGPEQLRLHLHADTEKRLQSGEPLLPAVLFVFAAPDITYGEMITYLRPVLDTHGTVYVFLEYENTAAR